MRRTIWVIMVTVSFIVVGCGSQEQPATKPATPTPPAATAPTQPPAPSVEPVTPPSTNPMQPSKPVAATAEAPTELVSAPAPSPKPSPSVKDGAPDLLTFDASQGKVTFHHLTHAKAYPCSTCHGDGTPGKISLGKDAAHNLCRSCHKEKGAGPTNCTGCHKK